MYSYAAVHAHEYYDINIASILIRGVILFLREELSSRWIRKSTSINRYVTDGEGTTSFRF